MPEQKISLAVAILAAGPSSRMGQPKQLLKIGDDTLIRKIVKEAVASRAGKVAVVLGAHGEIIRKEIADLPIDFIFNQEWEKGMGTSIKAAVHFLMKIKEVDAIIFTVCDQPALSSIHLEKLMQEHFNSQFPIIASRYASLIGVPALFHRSVVDKLLAIENDSGAKKIIEQNPALVKSVDFPEGIIDLDTPEDLKNYLF